MNIGETTLVDNTRIEDLRTEIERLKRLLEIIALSPAKEDLYSLAPRILLVDIVIEEKGHSELAEEIRLVKRFFAQLWLASTLIDIGRRHMRKRWHTK